MSDFKMMQSLHIPAKTKIVHLVMDGVGGLPREPSCAAIHDVHDPSLVIQEAKCLARVLQGSREQEVRGDVIHGVVVASLEQEIA